MSEDQDAQDTTPVTPESASGSDETPETGAPKLPDDVLAASEEEIRQELGIGNSSQAQQQEDIDALLAAATAEDAALTQGLPGGVTVHSAPLPSGGETVAAHGGVLDQNLQLLRDVHMKVKVELGRGHMYLKDILRLGQGSVVELERLAGDPLDIYVNDKVIARGEVLVLNENFCIRITEIHNPADVLKHSS